MILPPDYLKHLESILKEEVSSYQLSLKDKKALGLRANTLKISPERLSGILEGLEEPVKWCKEGFYYDEEFKPGKSPYYHAGLFYIQEPSAMLPASVIPIEENDKVLDLCAAPGGKSTYIGSRLKGKGLLVSNDISPSRAKILLKNIELAGIKNACVLSEAPEKLSLKFPQFFDKILIDAPCSGEGMFRKDENAVNSYIEKGPEYYIPIQKNLLLEASKMLRPGGIIAYSTCTFNIMENELIIKDFLDNNLSFSIMPIDHEDYGISKGMAILSENAQSLSACGRIWPQRQKGEGHFIALLKHNGEKMPYEAPPFKENKIKNIEYFHDFCRNNLNIKLEGNMVQHESSLMMLPYGITDLKGIRTVRSGFYLGDLKEKRFEPSHALAMALNKNNAKNIVSFTETDEALYRYLKGESLHMDIKDGYVLLCLNEWPIGWGKASNGQIKNKYPKGLMMN